jgi:hypothetical protein
MRWIVGITGISLWVGLIAFAVARGLESKDVEPAPKASQESGAETTSIETLAKDLVSSLASDNYKEAVKNFDGTMKNALPAEKLQQVWNSIIAQSGPFIEQAGTRREKILQYDAIFITCKFENAVLDTKVVFDRKQQIAGLFFVPSQETAK